MLLGKNHNDNQIEDVSRQNKRITLIDSAAYPNISMNLSWEYGFVVHNRVICKDVTPSLCIMFT